MKKNYKTTYLLSFIAIIIILNEIYKEGGILPPPKGRLTPHLGV